jgi:hypothetical protein
MNKKLIEVLERFVHDLQIYSLLLQPNRRRKNPAVRTNHYFLMKNIIAGLLLTLFFCTFGCMKDNAVQPEIITDPPMVQLIGSDSIYSDDYLGMGISQKAETIYSVIQSLQQSKGVSYLNVVSNVSSDITQLQSRIPLYKYILLDQKEGTDSGIQITLESGVVTSIYVNSGKKLSQWPEKSDTKSSVRIGDQAAALYEKLIHISKNKSYSSKFERIFLQTKELSASYDPVMTESPQWYFTYTVGTDLTDHVEVHFQQGKVKYIKVLHYKR